MDFPDFPSRSPDLERRHALGRALMHAAIEVVRRHGPAPKINPLPPSLRGPDPDRDLERALGIDDIDLDAAVLDAAQAYPDVYDAGARYRADHQDAMDWGGADLEDHALDRLAARFDDLRPALR